MRWLIYKSHWYSKQIGWHRSTKKAHVWISIIFNSIFVFTSYIVTPILWIIRNSELSLAYSVVLNFIFRIICKRQNKMLQTGSGNQAKGQVKGFLSRRLDLTSLPSTYPVERFQEWWVWGAKSKHPQEPLAAQDSSCMTLQSPIKCSPKKSFASKRPPSENLWSPE